ncbi:MAG: ABC transporter ATP-binding protein, partial [Sulfuricurvum sp.]|nr:ABC transporter ATP-binding protein [Sulfuricurvum sp.]
MPNTAISVKHLTKIYKLYDKPVDRLKESLHPLGKKYHKEFYALNDVSFEIKKGETVGIIGKNGAGKSTLLKIITGVLTPTSGSVHVHGRISSLLELGAGFNPEYTGVENIYLQGTLLGLSREEMEAKIDDILTFADIGDFVHQSVKMYSSGMFARLAFAVAINVDPDVLIVDEALSVGDSMFQHKCTARMRELMEVGTTILFVSHSIDSVRALCDKAVWIQDGSIKMIGDATELT